VRNEEIHSFAFNLENDVSLGNNMDERIRSQKIISGTDAVLLYLDNTIIKHLKQFCTNVENF